MVERWESVVCMLTCFQCILSDVHSTTATRNSLTALRRLSSPVSYMRPAAHFVRRVHAAAPTRTRCATRQAGTRRREEHSQRRASHNLCSILHRTRCRAGDGCAQNMGKNKAVPTHGDPRSVGRIACRGPVLGQERADGRRLRVYVVQDGETGRVSGRVEQHAGS